MATATAQKKGATQEKAPAPAPASKTHPCNCLVGTGKQCGEETTRAFARGHDARMSSRLADEIAAKSVTKAQAAKLIKDAGGSDLLVSKTHHSAELRIEKNKAPAKAKATAAARGKPAKESAAKQATDKAAPKSPIGTRLQVKHGETAVDAVVVRNAGEELVARHRHQGVNCDHPYADGSAEDFEDELDDEDAEGEDDEDEYDEDEDDE